MFPSVRIGKKKESKEGGSSFSSRYNTFCYHLLGRRLEKENDEGRDKLAQKLRQANITMTPGLYLARNYVTSLIVFFISLVLYAIIFALILVSPMWLLFMIALSSVSAGSVLMFFPFTMNSRITNRAARIDQELPFTLSELSILASTGLSPVEIVRRIAKRTASETVSAEFKKTVYKLDVEGKDLISALSETARESPSQSFRETLWDLTNMIHQGGDLDRYLRTKADDVMKTKRAVQKEFIDKIATYSDIYITVVLVGVLFAGIGAFLMDAMDSPMMGLDGDSLLLLTTFLALPLAIFMIGIIVAMSYSKVE